MTGWIAGILLLAALLWAAGRLLLGQRTFVMGTDILPEQVTGITFTRSSSAMPPWYQRYGFEQEGETMRFSHQRREGKRWPLTEEDIVASGSRTLTAEQKAQLFALLSGGEVTKAEEAAETGGSGPWVVLCWQGDRGKYQRFSFPDYGARESFAAFCAALAADG